VKVSMKYGEGVLERALDDSRKICQREKTRKTSSTPDKSIGGGRAKAGEISKVLCVIMSSVVFVRKYLADQQPNVIYSRTMVHQHSGMSPG